MTDMFIVHICSDMSDMFIVHICSNMFIFHICSSMSDMFIVHICTLECSRYCLYFHNFMKISELKFI